MSQEESRIHDQSTDLAGVEHWNAIYKGVRQSSTPSSWHPQSYEDLTIDWALQREIHRANPSSVLEIGCGNSKWLSYLAKTYSVRIAGMDYSPEGCRLARESLEAEDIDGEVYCCDLFDEDSANIGQFDFVFSLGVVEHFDNLEHVLGSMLRFVKPGGFLFTEIPNLASVHGLMSWIWQPDLLAKHCVITRRRLRRVYLENLHMTLVRAYHAGLFSLNIVAWEIQPRWPRVARLLLPGIRQVKMRIGRMLHRTHCFRGFAPLAPYAIVCGRKSES